MAKLVVVIHFLVLVGALTIRDSASKVGACLEAEKQALLSFKRNITHPSNEFLSWVSEENDCCEWGRIVCDSVTGHVTELNLGGASLSGKISPSLLNLKNLTRLDLSYNSFRNIEIPSFLGSLASLRFLDLEEAGFVGMVPHQLGNLSNLNHLRITSNVTDGLYSKSLHWISGLSSLEYLVLKNVNLNQASHHWLLALNKLPLLLELRLSSCELSHTHSESLANFTSLTILDLSRNRFHSPIPDWVFSLTRLVYLLMPFNTFSGPIPESVARLSTLETLDLSNNNLNGSLPETLGSLSSLKELDIYENHFEGTVSEVHFANLTNFNTLRASGNSLSLKVSPNWRPPFRLDIIGLGSWNLGSKFPLWLKSHNQVWSIDLSNTGIEDSIPGWFWNLSTNLMNMDLSRNQIYGTIPSTLNVTYRTAIYLSSNNLEGPLPRISSLVRVLDLSNNSFSGDLSRLLCRPLGEQNRLAILRLGENPLSGEIPNDCWSHWRNLEVVELRSNNLRGEIPSGFGHYLPSLKSLHLRNNSLSGEIPISLRNCSMLRAIDFGLNKIVGTVPRWIGNKYLPNLIVVILRSNKLRGDIPNELCGLTELQILDVAENSLSGAIPSCFGNFKAMATKPESLAPIFINSFSFANFVENAFVVTRGREDKYDTILPLLTSLDLSRNNLNGEIPRQLTSLRGLMSMNLSSNRLSGVIPDKVGDMSWVQSLDLSWNHLQGRIPPSIGDLHFLSHLDVSYNNLSGEIPTTTQLQTTKASSFVGNEFLCGAPLPKSCRDNDINATTTPVSSGEDDDQQFWFRLGIGMGFGVSFVGVIAPLLIFKIWRRAYFWFFQEYVWYNILDGITRLKYKMGITTPVHLA